MPRPNYTEEQVAEGRRRLSETALALYRAKGYSAVTLRELGAASGVSHATPYRYFESKEDLFLQVRGLVYTHFADHLRDRDPQSGDPLIRLRCILRAYIEFAQTWPDDYRLIFSLRQGETPEDSLLAAARRRTIEHVTGVCQEAIDAGLITGDASVHVHLAWTNLHGLASLHVSRHLVHGVTLDQLVEPMLDRLLAPMARSQALRRVSASRAGKTAAVRIRGSSRG